MNRIIFSGAIFICAFFAIAQPGPRKIKPETESIPIALNEEKSVYVRSLDVNIRANELAATTTLEMEIYNQGNRMMDGVIEFALSEGQVISGFKLDIGKNMREGVIVEKKKGRKTYETIVNRKVDPGLLELTAGNNYRLSVYPVPAHGSRRVSITIDQEMKPSGDEVIYSLPILFSREIENYKLEIVTENTRNNPVVRKGFLENLSFEGGSLFYEQKKVMLNSPHSFSIPIDRNESKVCVDSRSYFTARIPYAILGKDDIKSSSLTVFWDNSSSAKNRNIIRELDFLQACLEKFQFRKLKLVVFNNEIQEISDFETPHLKIDRIRSFIQSQRFDGATNLEVVNNVNLMLEQNILFSDGINNFGRNNFVINNPLHTVSSSAISDPYLLKYLANSSGGHFIDLESADIKLLVEGMANPVQQYAKAKGKNVSELIAKYQNGFIQVSGKLDGEKGSVELEIGKGKNRKKMEAEVYSKEICSEDLSLKAMRAAKINLESLVSFNGEEKIRTAGSDLGIVTAFTSLIVLETLQDYIQFEILPPAELMEEYNKNVIVKNRKNKPAEPELKEIELEEIIEDLVFENENRNEWWRTKFPIKPIRKNTVARNNGRINSDSTVVLNSSGFSSTVTVTGASTITAPPPPQTPPPPTPVPPTPSTNRSDKDLVIVMQESDTRLNEVIVTVPYGVAKRSAFTGSESRVVVRGLAGQVSGLIVGNGSPGTSPSISVRQESSIRPDTLAATEKKLNESKITLKQLLALNATDLYNSYFDLKNTPKGNDPAFYMEVASRLYELKSIKTAKRVLSNLAELDLEDHQSLRAMAYVFESWKDYRSAIFIYEKVLRLRDEEPQSFRDLALAKNANGEHQQAVDLLYKALTSDLEKSSDQFDGILSIMLNELNAIIGKHGNDLKLDKIDKAILSSMPVDLRIVIDWNKDQTDIDLHIEEPGNVKCNYQDKQSRNGGIISEDMTQGYGPEEYSIRKAVRGQYKIRVNYYGDNYQKQQVPSFIKVSIYKNFGRVNETVEIKNMYMKGRSGMVDVAELVFE